MLSMQAASVNRVGVAYAVLASLCWGAATVLSKLALADIQPVLLLVLQLLASVAALWVIIFIRRIPVDPMGQFRQVALLGVLEPGLAFLLTLIGLTDLRAGAASLIQSTESIMIVVVSALLLRTRPAASFVVYSFLAFAGLVLALGLTNTQDMAGNGVFGIAALMAGTAVAAVYVVLSSRLAAGMHPLLFVAIQQTVSLVFALLVLPFEIFGLGHDLALPSSLQTWGVVVASGVLQYAMAFSLYISALAKLSANFAGIFLNLIPIFGLAGGYALLGEKLSLLQLAGACITIAAVMALSRSGLSASH